LQELLPAYVIGGLDAAEKQLVERLLQECPEMANDLRDYAQLSQAMNFAAEPVQPPAHLHANLMAAIAEPAPQVTPLTPVPRRPNRLWAALAIAASLLLIMSNLYWFTQVRQLQESELAVYQLLAAERTTLVSLSGSGSQRVQLVSTESGEDQIYASVIWNPQVDQALLYSNQLPFLSPGRAYQLWLIDDAAPISGGIFQIDNRGQGMLIFQPPAPIGDYAALAISEEPAAGSPAPTTDPLALGEV
jgi:anti-sigma-K factor RskA